MEFFDMDSATKPESSPKSARNTKRSTAKIAKAEELPGTCVSNFFTCFVRSSKSPAGTSDTVIGGSVDPGGAV